MTERPDIERWRQDRELWKGDDHLWANRFVKAARYALALEAELVVVRERAERLERGVMHHANDGCAKCAADLAASTQEDE